MKLQTRWQHRTERRESQRVQEEPRAGTEWWFIAGVASIKV
jgi:hypothetical protein